MIDCVSILIGIVVWAGIIFGLSMVLDMFAMKDKEKNYFDFHDGSNLKP